MKPMRLTTAIIVMFLSSCATDNRDIAGGWLSVERFNQRLADLGIAAICPKHQCDQLPKFKGGFAPDYPREYADTDRDGEVTVRMVIDTNGRVRDLRFVSQTDPAFGKAALQALPTWQFEPAMLKGQAVAVEVVWPMPFSAR
jgi:TonB family protein